MTTRVRVCSPQLQESTRSPRQRLATPKLETREAHASAFCDVLCVRRTHHNMQRETYERMPMKHVDCTLMRVRAGYSDTLLKHPYYCIGRAMHSLHERCVAPGRCEGNAPQAVTYKDAWASSLYAASQVMQGSAPCCGLLPAAQPSNMSANALRQRSADGRDASTQANLLNHNGFLCDNCAETCNKPCVVGVQSYGSGVCFVQGRGLPLLDVLRLGTTFYYTLQVCGLRSLALLRSTELVAEIPGIDDRFVG